MATTELGRILDLARKGTTLLPGEAVKLVQAHDALYVELVRVKALCKSAYAEGFMNGYLHVPNDTAAKSWEHSTTYRELQVTDGD